MPPFINTSARIIMRFLSLAAQRSPKFVAENGTADYGGEEYVCVSTALHTSAAFCFFSLWINPQLLYFWFP